MEFFFEHPQIRRLIAETLNEEQVRKRGYFEPAYVKNLLSMMETREFIYLKQVMALVILELWHRIFIDNEKAGRRRLRRRAWSPALPWRVSNRDCLRVTIGIICAFQNAERMILVTGGLGVMGSTLVKGFVDRGFKVRVLDNSDRFRSRLDGYDVDIRIGDITKPETLVAASTGCETVYHLAAVLIVYDPSLFQKINVVGTRNVIDASIKAGVKPFHPRLLCFGHLRAHHALLALEAGDRTHDQGADRDEMDDRAAHARLQRERRRGVQHVPCLLEEVSLRSLYRSRPSAQEAGALR